MIIQDVFLKRVNWHIKIYYAVDTYYAMEISDDLIRIGCRGENLKAAEKMLWGDNQNTGLTYSNLDTHETVMVISLSSSAAEYYNSFCHEQLHVMQHISQSYKINMLSEDICYILGELAQSMFAISKKLLCDCCRHKGEF